MPIVDLISPIDGVILKWFRSTDTSQGRGVQKGSKVVTIATSVGGREQQVVPVLSPCGGAIYSIEVDSCGHSVRKGQVLATIVPCEHPALFKRMCVSCGEKVTPAGDEVGVATTATGVVLSKQEARDISQEKIVHLRRGKKLALVLDIDHTMVHAVKGHRPLTSEESALYALHCVTIQDSSILGGVEHTWIKLRPHLDTFLSEMTEICQLSIFTAGSRPYADAVTKLIDPTGRFFGSRIACRCDTSGGDGVEKSLHRIFYDNPSMVIIMDDREDAWTTDAEENLLLVKPYRFFGSNDSIDPVITLSGLTPGSILRMTHEGKGEVGFVY
jgi:RNA polymerase II subunit A C-terminal domain phosphatase